MPSVDVAFSCFGYILRSGIAGSRWLKLYPLLVAFVSGSSRSLWALLRPPLLNHSPSPCLHHVPTLLSVMLGFLLRETTLLNDSFSSSAGHQRCFLPHISFQPLCQMLFSPLQTELLTCSSWGVQRPHAVPGPPTTLTRLSDFRGSFSPLSFKVKSWLFRLFSVYIFSLEGLS